MNVATKMIGDVTELLEEVSRGDQAAWDSLFGRVYEELHRLAERHRRSERSNHTLQTTAIVSEAFLRLVNERERSWKNRKHFLAIASQCMRRVLVRYAEQRHAIKRGGRQQPVALDEALLIFESRGDDLLAVNEALTALAAHDPRKAQIVELRFFGGLDMGEIASLLELSERTIERDWRMAKAWIRTALDRTHPSS